MLRVFLKKEWHYLRWILLIALAINIGIVVTIGLTYHYTLQFLEEIPEDLFQLLQEYRLSRSFLILFEDYPTYLWSQWNAKNLLQLGSIVAIIMASLQFAGERSKKTMSFLLSRPLQRKEVFLGKVVAGLVFLLSVFGISTLLLYLTSTFMGYGDRWGEFFLATLLSLLWLSVFYLFCSIISIKVSEPIPAGAAMGGAALLLSIFGLFSSTERLSLFYHIRAGDYFLMQATPLLSLVPGLLIGGLLVILGLHLFLGEDY